MLLSYRYQGHEAKSICLLADTHESAFIYAHYLKLDGHTDITIDGKPLAELYTKGAQ